VAPTANYDAAWKAAVQAFFRAFLELCFPPIFARVDWSRPTEFLDQELQAVLRDAEIGLRRADLLAKVFCLAGTEEWILIHVEVQSQRDPGLPERMFTYYMRIRERYGRPVVGLALLADEQPGWKPAVYETETWGCGVQFRYHVCKVTELDRASLQRSANPIATVVLAYLSAQATRGDALERKADKWRLARGLYERGLGKEEILSLFRLIDWMLALPQELEIDFRRELLQFEQEKAMTYVTSIERLGREEGREEGRQEGLLQARRLSVLDVLEARFGPVPETVEEKLQAVADEASLRRVLGTASTARSITAFLQTL
jgi:predicted transposase YdaD